MKQLQFALIALVVATLLPDPAAACSVARSGIMRGTAPFFVFSARSDTVAVPAWTPRAGNPPASFSGYGQLVDISRLDEQSEPGLPEALRRSAGRAVVVPWTAEPNCRLRGWVASSYRWVTSPAPAFLSAGLRPRSAWHGDLPTFDVSLAYLEPYPHDPWLRGRYFSRPPRDRSQLLGADEYFELYEALPTHEEWGQAPERSVEQISQWLGAHPELAEKYPANSLLAEAEEEREVAEGQAELERLREIRPPLAGTYRLDVTTDDGPARTLYVRTRSRATSEWTVRPRDESLSSAEQIRQRDGYTILSAGGPALDALPKSCQPGEREMEREGYLSLLEHPEIEPDGARVWHGKISLDLVALQFPDAAELNALARLDFERFSGRYTAGLRTETPAVFRRQPDGSVRVQQRLVFDDGRAVDIIGERISTVAINCDW